MSNHQSYCGKDDVDLKVGDTYKRNGKDYIVLWITESRGFKVILTEENLDPIKRRERNLDMRRDVENYLRICKKYNIY